MDLLKMIFDKMEIDVYAVLEAASTKWNFLKFTPGEDPLIGAVRRINTNNTVWRVFGIYLSNPGDYVWLIFNSLSISESFCFKIGW